MYQVLLGMAKKVGNTFWLRGCYLPFISLYLKSDINNLFVQMAPNYNTEMLALIAGYHANHLHVLTVKMSQQFYDVGTTVTCILK